MTTIELEPRYYDKKGIATKFSCSVRWIEERMREGLPHFEIAGRTKFRLEEVERWLDQRGEIKRRGER